MKPRLLDLFCGAGGCSVGYARAGFEVWGVDIAPQRNYPFPWFAVRADALDVLRELLDGKNLRRDISNGGHHSKWVGVPLTLGDFDAIHASPPCQDYSRAMRHLSAPQPRLIEPVRELLVETGLPWVIENVPGAPLSTASDLFGSHGVELCGTMFGLRVRRHRLFETSFPVAAPGPCDHSQPAMNPHNQAGRDRIYAEFGRQDPDPIWNREMGVPWMGKYDGREAVPPAYTEHIGGYLLAHLKAQAMEAA